MREILFRAKAKDDGKWIEGFPVRIYDYGGKVWEMHPFETNFNVICGVIPETIGQFTGLTDKNGKKIFEGDIVQYSNPDEDIIHGTVAYGNHSCCGTHEVGFFMEWQKPEFAMCLREDIGFWTNFREIEVIGNIHDNPELLGGEKDG